MIFAKNISIRSYGIICLPRMPPTTLNTPKDGYQSNQRKVGKTLIVPILTKYALFRSYGRFAYLLRAHIRNINIRRYITSACGHELSGRVHPHAYNYYAWDECLWVAK